MPSHWKRIMLVAATVSCLGVARAASDTPFSISTRRSNDVIEVESGEQRAVIAIHSPFGISQASIERTGENWPRTIVLQLHLKGLESFKVTSGEVTIEAAASSQNGEVRQWIGGKEETPLDQQSPYWMEILVLDKEGKPTATIPLAEGHFQMQLPGALFEGNPQSISVNWIDFYR